MKRIVLVSWFLFLVFFINTTYAGVRFAVISDTHEPYHSEHSDLINLISNLNPKPDFVINLGDITDDGEQTQWETWQSVVSPLGIDWNVDPPQYIGVVGNCDALNPNWDLNWANFLVGQQRYGDGKSFAFGYDNALFIVLDSQNNTPASWLEDTLNQLAGQYEWIFAFWHHPPYTFGATPMDSASKEDWGPILQSHGAQIIFHGHAHYYVRTFPMFMDGSDHPVRDDQYGIIEVINGGGGGNLFDLDPSANGYGELFAQGKKAHHFTLIDIDDKALSMKVIDHSGTIIDSFGIALDDSVDQYPKSEITSPANGDVVSGTITVEVAATDDDQIVQVDFYIDDDYSGTDFFYPYSHEFNSNEIIFGDHTFRAVATDSIGQETWSSVIVTVTPSSDEYELIQIAAGADDAEESASGITYMNSSDLELVYDDYANSGNQTVGLRFTGVNIPRGATISNAYIQFQVDETSWEATSVRIVGENTDNAAIFGNTYMNISSRDQTVADAWWFPNPWITVGESGLKQKTPDISSIISEIVNRPGWSAGNSMVFIITGTGRRVAESYDGDKKGAPFLFVRYSSDSSNQAPVVTITAPAGGASFNAGAAVSFSGTANDAQDGDLSAGLQWVSSLDGPIGSGASFSRSDLSIGNHTITSTVTDSGSMTGVKQVGITVINGVLTAEIQVTSGSNDAEESASGTMNMNSSDLELVYDSYAGAGNQNVGLRFNAVGIPWGATIHNAYIQFKVDETSTEATLLRIVGEDTDNAAVFVSTSGNISSRNQTTAEVWWSPDSWTSVGQAGLLQQTPDLASIISEIVSRPGWSAGNAMVLIINGTGHRVAESYEGDPNGAPRLFVEYSTGSANQPPAVDAGPDRTIYLPEDSVFLDATLRDDGLPNPPAAVSTHWGQVSGPGAVLFADENAVDTTAIFPEVGTYVLRLEADDGELLAGDDVTILVNEAGSEVYTVEIRIAASADDAEESTAGTIYLSSSDLELVFDDYANAGDQTVGMRFRGVQIPRGATIVNAYIQFKVDETSSVATYLTIEGQDIDNAPLFGSSVGNISNRDTTPASVGWVPPAWNTVGASGVNQRTPNISPIIQQIVDRENWISGNSMAMIITGSGWRVAESYDGDPNGAALLHVEYTIGH